MHRAQSESVPVSGFQFGGKHVGHWTLDVKSAVTADVALVPELAEASVIDPADAQKLFCVWTLQREFSSARDDCNSCH